MKRLFHLAALLVLLIAAGLAGFLASYILGTYHNHVIARFDQAGRRAATTWERMFPGSAEPAPRLADAGPIQMRFSTVFVPLQGHVIALPRPEQPGAGGSLTSWGDQLVVITHEGGIYLVGPDLTVSRSGIEAPPYGLADYQAAAAKPPFDRVEHRFDYLRYNDIAAFNDRGRQGFLVSYTRFDKQRTCYQTVVSRLFLDDEAVDLAAHQVTAGQWEDLFESEPCLPLKMTARAIEGHIAGGRLAIDGTGTAYLSVGDYHWDGSFGPGSRPGTDPESNPPLAQDPAADYGKVIAIDLRSGQTRQMSRGHRNPQGIALDRRGNVWIVDQGMRGGDELNRIIDGEDYGWPLESYGTLYSALPLPHTKSFGRHAVFRRPEMAWLPSIATSGLTRIEGFHEAWDGDLLASTLRGRMLARIRIADNRAVFSEFIEIGLRIRQVHQHGDGRIVLWTDDQQLIFLSPTSGGLGFKYANYRLDMMDADDATVRKVRAALQGCMECHSLNKGENVTAPSLAEVYEAEIGSTAYKGYSVALQADGRRWNKALLAAYLADPQATVPGTNMPDPVIADSRVRQGIVDILEGLATEIEIPRRFRDR